MQNFKLIQEIERLEILCNYYANTWGTECPEYKTKKAKLDKLNMELLDLLTENRGL